MRGAIQGLDDLGHLFMVGMPGPDLDLGTESLLLETGAGGVILFRRNINGPVQLALLCSALQEIARRAARPPLFLAVDQEGGRVSRLPPPFSQFPGNAAIGSSPTPPAMARAFARTTAIEMALVGLNMDLAPVLDVAGNHPNPALDGRMFGPSSRHVAQIGALVVRELQAHGVMAVAKHFPGLGNAACDPHLNLPTVLDSEASLRERHMRPFLEAIRRGVSGIMSSHALYPALDPENPATLSRRILTGICREDMGFQGLILTDDLEMGAIEKTLGVAQGALQAFEAGADLLLVCKDQEKVRESLSLLKEELAAQHTLEDRLRTSLERIAQTKARFLSFPGPPDLPSLERYFGRSRT